VRKFIRREVRQPDRMGEAKCNPSSFSKLTRIAQSVTRPIGGIEPKPDLAVRRGVGPVDYPFHIAVFYRVVMDIVNMSLIDQSPM